MKILVEEFTTPSPIVVDPGDNVLHVKQQMRDHGIRHVPVVKGKSVVGILSDRDLRLIDGWFNDLSTLRVDFVMTPDPYVVSPQTPLESVAFHMSKEKIGSAIVQSMDEDYLGIFTSTDALNALLELLRGQV